ncbi:putative increased DNA methylation 1 [Cocos nucifera]|uniref:Putative increased DNA methylation 1 n=1 Tax=Cocos nucifera TaxID=13894 RepID=A0A8K0N7I2_COCNU|nr:putative increased DNA methylation 1 [Cocos nucifera]
MANGDGPSDTEDYVLRSGVRSGLKREFAFALRSQAALPVSLGRTRSGKSLSSSPAALSRDFKRPKKADAQDLASEADGPPPEPVAPNPAPNICQIEAEAPVVVDRLDEAKTEAPIVVDAQDEAMTECNLPENWSVVDNSSQIGVLDEAKVDGDTPIKSFTKAGLQVTSEGSLVLAVASSPPIEAAGSVIDDNGVETQIVIDDNVACKANGDRLENGCALEDPIVIDGQDGLRMDGTARVTRSSSKVILQEPATTTPLPTLDQAGSVAEMPIVLDDHDELKKPTKRFTRSALKDPPMDDEVVIVEFPMVINAHDGSKDENSLSEKSVRKFTRQAIKAREEDSGAGETVTTSSGSVGSEDRKAEANSEDGSLNSTPKKKMELKMSKKIVLTKLPTNVRDLLATGLLEGLPVKYNALNGKQAVLQGVIKGNVILCSCSSCNGSKAVSAYQFELHAGSTKKHPSDFIFLENGNSLRDVIKACTSAPLDMLEAAIQNAIGQAPPKKPFTCQKCKESFLTSLSGKFALLCDSCLDSKQQPKTPSPSHGTASTVRDLGLHKLVFMNDILPQGTEVAYYVRGKRLLQGYIKESGIYCHCCKNLVSPSQFEAHAGRASRRKPYNNIYTSNGVSLHELSVLLSNGRKLSTSENDDLCSICADGGDLLLCDLCPRAFHKECIGLSSIPRGDWHCQYCQNLRQRDRSVAHNDNAIAAGRVAGVDPMEQISKRQIRIVSTPNADIGGCVLCRCHDFCKSGFDDRTVMLCDQCEREYHVGCLREHKMADLKELPEGEWFCTSDCTRIRTALHKLLLRGAQPLPLLDADVIKKKRESKGFDKDANIDIRWRLLSGKTADAESKLLLSKAVAIFHESFDPIVDAVTGRDLIPTMVYGRTVRDQDYGGMYCVLLTVGTSVVSAGILRVLGSEIAELPLVATSREHQGQGYFQSLFSCIERLLVTLKVQHFVLPAADEAESIWTQKFGFTKITSDEESFDPIVDAVTGRDLIPTMVYGRTVRDQDYGGMYCVLLTVGTSVVSAGILRVLGSEIAELPLVATSREHQGQVTKHYLEWIKHQLNQVKEIKMVGENILQNFSKSSNSD